MARLKGEIAGFEKQIAAPDFYRKTSDVISGARRGLTEAQEKLAAAEDELAGGDGGVGKGWVNCLEKTLYFLIYMLLLMGDNNE